MRLASASDFNGSIYTNYRHHDGFAKRAQLFQFFPDPILVVGCAFGFLVEDLRRLRKWATGIDVSPYAIENRVGEFVHLGNILDLSNWQLGQFETVITEDLLPYLTDTEAVIAAQNCQAISPIVIHMVTEQGQADLNYHPAGHWMGLTKQITISLAGM